MDKGKTRILAHLLTLRETQPRRFWVPLGATSASLLAMMTAFAVAPPALDAGLPPETVVQHVELAASAAGADDDSFVRQERIQNGDTVAALFSRLGIEGDETLAALRRRPDSQPLFQQLRPGKMVTARTSRDGELVSLSFPLSGRDRVLQIERAGADFSVTEQPLALESRLVIRSGEIISSLFGATDVAGMPDSVATQLAEVFGGDIDFHRDLRRGDRFSVAYEMFYSAGQLVRPGRLIAAEFVNQGKVHRAFYYGRGGEGGYYGPDGKSLKKAFLRSPIEFSRVSSGFAMRLHPVLQTWRAHKGIDYSAPVGTRVRVTGDGVVEFVGRQGGYGNFVVVRHAGKYSTHYGHLNGFGPGVRKGARVGQGDVIGYVGTTGLTTGPHLHYEFRINDVHQNPLSVALPVAVPLEPSQLDAFRQHTQPLATTLALMRDARTTPQFD